MVDTFEGYYMAFAIIFILIITWIWWVPALLQLVLFLTPKSFFIEDSIQKKETSTKSKVSYTDSVPDFVSSLAKSTDFIVNQYMSAAQKAVYLQSPEWQAKRQLVLHRDNYCCKVCGSTIDLQVHHIRYTSLGNEPLGDLVTLCSKHHQELHDQLGYDRETTFDFSTLKN